MTVHDNKIVAATERDDFLLTMYHCDHMRFAAFCDDNDCDRVDFLNNTLSDKEISSAIERYNIREFGLTSKQCKQGECLFCKDINLCDRANTRTPREG